MIHTLKCPSCAAPVDFNDDDAAPTFRCHFCNNTVVVPESMRRAAGPPPAEQVQVFVPYTYHRRQHKSSLVPLAAVFIVLALIGIVFAVVFFGVMSSINSTVSHVTNIQTLVPNGGVPANPTAPTGSSVATVTLKFGSEGTGPGYFTDARSIALDGQGHIYVGEYLGGRIQVFDASGKFVTQWTVDPKMPLRGMAADRKGTVYVVQRGEIHRYEGITGRQLGKVSYGETGFDDVTVAADGGLVAAYRRHRDDIVRFDPSGNVAKVMQAAISGQTDRSELNMRVAVDGTGTVYALGTFNDAVFKFNPDGRYVTRFGSAGDKPGQLRAPSAIAVDNKGRVYVTDIKGIQIFDSDGRYIDLFKADGPASGLVFNDRNELFVVARKHVIKYALK